jgi:hypothetical protein
MSTFTAIKTGPASDPTTFSGSPATPPTGGDTLLVQGFTVVLDYSINSGTALAVNDTSTSDGYVAVVPGRTVLMSLTGNVRVRGIAGLEYNTANSFHEH